MILHLNLCGGLMLALALLHAIFPRYFQWKRELATLGLMNRQMMVIHTFFIALTVGLMGALLLTSASDLTGTALGKRVLSGLIVFWGIRFVLQFFGYSPALWRRKRFETGVHLLFSLLWAYFLAVLLAAYLF
jgi:hypothetical protein